jgi:hypothetical protein
MPGGYQGESRMLLRGKGKKRGKKKERPKKKVYALGVSQTSDTELK